MYVPKVGFAHLSHNHVKINHISKAANTIKIGLTLISIRRVSDFAYFHTYDRQPNLCGSRLLNLSGLS